MTTKHNPTNHYRKSEYQQASIKTFSKSLFSQYLRGDYTSAGFCILSSKQKNPMKILEEIKEEQKILNNTFRVDENFETVTFKVTSAISGLRFTHKINLKIHYRPGRISLG
ncbi:hypothetical protein DMUE_0236 [Dictyocoela muelleri]|nr:hypothetical protein DMUE_0236 [Dictyocoela muelleri]